MRVIVASNSSMVTMIIIVVSKSDDKSDCGVNTDMIETGQTQSATTNDTILYIISALAKTQALFLS